MPNALVRFQKMAGWIRTVLFGLVFVALTSLAIVEIVGGNITSPLVWFLPGLLLGALLQPLLVLQPVWTAKVLNGFWLVYMLYVLLGHKALGKPQWSDCLIFASAGLYLAASFVFYSSRLLYIASLVAESPDPEAVEGDANR